MSILDQDCYVNNDLSRSNVVNPLQLVTHMLLYTVHRTFKEFLDFMNTLRCSPI